MLALPSTTVLYLSPMRLIFNCYSGKNFTTNDRNILKTLPGLVLTYASLVRAQAQRPLVSSLWKTAPLFFLHTVCFLRVQPRFNSRRPTSLLSSLLPSSSLRYSVATSLPLPRTAQKAGVMRSCGSWLPQAYINGLFYMHETISKELGWGQC